MKAELDRAREARRILEKVRARLLRPSVEALNGGAADLTLAVAALERLEVSFAQRARPDSIPRALETELIALRRELRRVEELAAAAMRFHAGWVNLMSTVDEAPGNYTSAGEEASALAQTGRMVFDG